MEVTQRFLKYVSFDTTSSETSDTVPTTDHQKVLGRYLAQELAELGLEGAHMDDKGYVYALLPATPGCQAPALGLIAHMDTSPAVSGADIHPEIVTYQGGDLPLRKAGSLKVKDFPFLERYIGQELIVTDGTTLLGADDKAGVAEIMSAVEYLLQHPELPHGRIAVGFTPDEEVGQGADHFDVEGFGAAVAYTVDGGELGELEYENFNAANAGVYFHGVNIHPGEGKNKMRNACLMAAQFIAMVPPAEAPAHTEGYEGFYHLCAMTGDESQARLEWIIRDHDQARFAERKETLTRIGAYLERQYGPGSVEVILTDSYYNMKERILPHPQLLDWARVAFRKAGVEPREAYEMVHRRELTAKAMHFAAQAAARQAVRVVESGGRRIPENAGRSASVSRPDPGKLTSRELADIRRRVMDGEKISF